MGRFSWLATSSESEPEYDDGEFYGPETEGFLSKCFYCNGRMEVDTSKDPRVIGRLFFKCQNDGDGSLHENKWWDESVTEEIEKIKLKAMEERDTLKTMTDTNEAAMVDQAEIFARLRVVEGSVVSLREEMEKCRMDLVRVQEATTVYSTELLNAIKRNPIMSMMLAMVFFGLFVYGLFYFYLH